MRTIKGYARVLLHIHQAAQHFTAARQARPDRADRNVEPRGHLLVAHPFETDEKNDLPLLFRPQPDRPFEVAQLQASAGSRRHRQHRRDVLHRYHHAFAHRAADLVYILIMQDREEPGAQISSRFPEMLLGNCADEAALHEIVGSGGIPSEGPSVPPQPRNFILQKPGKIAHDITYRSSTSGWPKRLRSTVNISPRCKSPVAPDGKPVKCCFQL